jgi:pyridoxine 5-phosphate synthase
MTALSVNLNKIAVLRNSRGGDRPSVSEAARVCVAAGAHGITVHPRPDQRHIRPHDVLDLRRWLPVELNVEGNPFAGASSNGYPGFLPLIESARPAQCTLVPDADAQLTSDHGFEPAADAGRLAPVVERLKRVGCRVSVFVDSGATELERLARIGVDRIEIYTGPFAQAFARGDSGAALDRCAQTARAAIAAGLGVNAGHDLNQANLAALLTAIPSLDEVSIGHALIDESLYAGLAATVRAYLRTMAAVAAIPR